MTDTDPQPDGDLFERTFSDNDEAYNAGLTREFGQAALLFLRAFTDHAGEEDMQTVVEQMREIDGAQERMWTRGVARWRATGWSDREIGEVLGMTKQAVAERWPRTPNTKEQA